MLRIDREDRAWLVTQPHHAEVIWLLPDSGLVLGGEIPLGVGITFSAALGHRGSPR